MLRLLPVFLDIALWRRGPQDLPASKSLAIAVAACYAIVDALRLRVLTSDVLTSWVVVASDVAMVTVWLWAVLTFFGRRERFLQTFTAVLGVGVLILILSGLVGALQRVVGDGDPTSGWLMQLIITALIVGRILMQALDRGLVTGMALTVAIIYSAIAMSDLTLGHLRG